MSRSSVFRNFDDDIDKSELEKEGPEFELGGETFHCLPVPPGGATLRLVNAVMKDDRGRQVYHLPDIDAFMREVLIEKRTIVGDDEVAVVEATDDVERWDKLLHDKERPIPIPVLGAVFMWLQAEYTSRPTAASVR